MTNYLKMPKKSQVFALLELGWSYRRIEAETGVRRETVSRYDRMRRANAAKTFAGLEAKPAETFPGSEPPARFAAAPYHDAILEKRAKRLTAQGYGETQPLDRRHNEAAWAKNRRVAFLIIKRATD